MKICPSCQKTYTDASLNFCLDDGATLSQLNESESQLPQTVLLNKPRQTSPNQPFGSQFGGQSGFGNQDPFSMQPPVKSSKTWLWAVGILGVLALLCGGGFIGFIALVANVDDTNDNNTNRVILTDNRKTPPPPKTPDDRTKFNEIDLSGWVKGDTELGITEYKNGELILGSKKKDFYYVILGTESDKTENATTKVSVRNINEMASSLGFGLIVNSDPKPLTQDYAFLIDSENKKYRVVRHQPGKEIDVIKWTNSSAIKNSDDENVLEIRDQSRQMNFYINGQFITSVKNTDGYSDGVLGLYSGDAVKIAFSSLQIGK